MQSTFFFCCFVLALGASVRCNELLAISKISADMENILRNISDVTMTSCQMECMRDPKCKTIGLTTSKTKGKDGLLNICYLLEKIKIDGNEKGSNFEMLQVKKLEPKASNKWKRITFISACERRIEKKLLAKSIKITKQYKVHVEVKPTHLATLHEYLTIVQFTKFANKLYAGYCIPKILGGNGHIHVCNALSDEPRVYVKRTLTINQWTTVTVSQFRKGTEFYQSVAFNGTEVSSEINLRPTEFDNVNVYLGDGLGEALQPGYVRNFWIDVEK